MKRKVKYVKSSGMGNNRGGLEGDKDLWEEAAKLLFSILYKLLVKLVSSEIPICCVLVIIQMRIFPKPFLKERNVLAGKGSIDITTIGFIFHL